jgi:hypothetical protein
MPLTSDRFDEWTACEVHGHMYQPCRECDEACGYMICAECDDEYDAQDL